MSGSKFSAVALKYPPYADAPFITAKSRGEAALRLVQIARDSGIPVVEDAVTENVLSMAKVGDCIPEKTWHAVAGIFAFIKELEQE